MPKFLLSFFTLAFLIFPPLQGPFVQASEHGGQCSWTGTWNTYWSGGSAVMDIVQSGDLVTGIYSWDSGIIFAEIKDGKLKGTWAEAPTYEPPNDGGYIEFELSEDCNSFEGNWLYGNTGEFRYWDGDRLDDGTQTNPPTGEIISPEDGSEVFPGELTYAVHAEDDNGVAKVVFYAKFDGITHVIGESVSPPYEIEWDVPEGLIPQGIQLFAKVDDIEGNHAIIGHHLVTYNPDEGDVVFFTNEVDKRIYFNQLSIPEVGYKYCGSASAAMLLAMNHLIR